MLSPLLWVSPAAQELLKSVSELLAGAVPCKPAQLATALKAADEAKLTGLLKDKAVREAFAAKLEAGCVKEISDKEASGLVEALGTAVQERLNSINKAAEPLAKKMKGDLPTFKDVVELLPKGQEPSEALRKDWLLWHAAGANLHPEQLNKPDKKLVQQRISLAASAGGGPLADCCLALHTLENLKAYVDWESALKGSLPPPEKAKDLKGQSVLFPFDAKTAKEVSARRILASILPPEAASSASAEVAGGKDVKAVVLALAEQCKARAVIPSYVAPPAPKEPKAGKEGSKEGGKEGKKKDGEAGGKKGEAAKGPSGPIGQFLQTTATQELQWHLLAYRLRPGTTLGKAPAGGAVGGASAGGAKRPEGFSGIWSPTPGQLPPGHTTHSWYHSPFKANTFDVIWVPHAGATPAGHTPYSWENCLENSSTPASASAPKAAPAAAKPKCDAAPAAKTPAPKAKAAAAGGAPEEGSVEAAFCKLDIRCGRIKECGRVPDADSLYLLKVDVGEEQPRQVVSSLVKFYKEDELKDRQVVVYCNIKPGKMRNFESQAMVLAAVKDKGTDKEQCELLTPPSGVKEGTRMRGGDLEAGSLSATASVKHISKVWGQVQPLLLTSGGCEATFQGTVLTLEGKPVKSATLSSAPIT